MSQKLTSLDSRDLETLRSRFPHVAEKIVTTWGTPDCRKYINTLLTDTRDGQRKGFPPATASSIFQLLCIHDRLYHFG